MASTQQFTPFLPVTALSSFMSHFDRTSASRSGAAPVAPSPAETPVVAETPAETRAMDVSARFFPALAYGQRRTLVRAIARMTEHPDSPRFEVEIRAAYRGAVIETTPSGLINPTPLDWTALWLSQQLPGAAMHVYRALVTRMLEHVRLLGAGRLTPEQTRIHCVYRKAASELATERE
jgi:hypothetical protein